MTEVSENVISKIVEADLCIGCGICAAVCPRSSLKMTISEFGEYKPGLVSGCVPNCGLCLKVCPFDDNDDNEDILGQKLFANFSGIKHDNIIGYFQNCYVGHLTDEIARNRAASGGLTSGLLKALLMEGVVDRIIVPLPTNKSKPLFEFQIVSSEKQIEESKGSVYHPLQMADVLREVINGAQMGYAITVLPCFAKAIRLAQRLSRKLQTRIKYVLGLTCGGCPNFQFTEVLSYAAGMPNPEKGKYRSKDGAKRADDFRFICEKKNAIGRPLPFDSVFGFLWQNKLFFHRVCTFCDDVFAELADICLMDAWLPEYIKDRMGTSLAICRSEELGRLIGRLSESGELCVQEVSKEKVIASQTGLIKYKRDEIESRIEAIKNLSKFIPKKRIWKRRKDIAPIDVIRARFKCWANAKQLWIKYRKSLPGSESSHVILRLKTWFFFYSLYKLLKGQGVPVSKKASLFLPGKLIVLKLIIRKCVLSVRDLILVKRRK